MPRNYPRSVTSWLTVEMHELLLETCANLRISCAEGVRLAITQFLASGETQQHTSLHDLKTYAERYAEANQTIELAATLWRKSGNPKLLELMARASSEFNIPLPTDVKEASGL